MTMDVFPKDPAGNWTILAEAGGLPPLPAGAVCEVRMTKNNELASPCRRLRRRRRGRGAGFLAQRADGWGMRPLSRKVLPGQAPSRWLLDGPVDKTPA